MGIAEKLAAQATVVVEIPELGIEVRAHKLTNIDLLAAGSRNFAAHLPQAPPENVELSDADKMEQTQIILNEADLWTIASVREGRETGENGGDWEPLRVVANETEQDPKAGLVWIQSLPMSARTAIFGAVYALTMAREGAHKAIATFRGRPESGAAGGQPGTPVRPDASRDPSP